MGAEYDGRARLASIAARLAAEAGRGDLPPLFLFTDPARTPDPARSVRGLPPGCGVVYRHFGAPDRARTARALRAACDEGGNLFLIAADPALALAAGADGAHWPFRMRGAMRRTDMAHFALNTMSAHCGRDAMLAARAGADIVFLSPVFASESQSAGRALGPLRAGPLARACPAPVYALGGANAETAVLLRGLGFAGIAAVGALSGPAAPHLSAAS